jgi:hypothetical protein
LLTTTMTGQKGVVEALQRHGLRLLRTRRRRERALLDEAGSSEGGRVSRFAEKLCSLWGRSFRSDVKCLAIFGASAPEEMVLPFTARSRDGRLQPCRCCADTARLRSAIPDAACGIRS